MEPRPKEPEDAEADLRLQAVPGVTPLPSVDKGVAPPSNCPLKRPLGDTDVFVDDFLQLAQGGPARVKALRRHLLTAVDQVLAQPNLDEKHRTEAISLKKLLKGDGSWSTRKIILGWLVDTVRQTIELPAHRKVALAEIFEELAATKRVSHKRYQSILGKLRFVSSAIPGSAGLFSALQLALTRKADNRVRITSALRRHIDAFASLAADLCKRPTYLAEVVPQDPSYLGTTDAAKMGMGGVFYDSTGQGYLWREPFLEDIQRRLVSGKNRNGDITNSDLEHAGILAQTCLIADKFDPTYATITTGSDNTPAISRVSRGAVSTEGAGANLCNFRLPPPASPPLLSGSLLHLRGRKPHG